MKEKIEKLFQSYCPEDILIGIELSYELPLEEFIGLYNERTFNIRVSKDGGYYTFKRDRHKWLLARGVVKTEYKHEGYEYIDISPKP